MVIIKNLTKLCNWFPKSPQVTAKIATLPKLVAPTLGTPDPEYAGLMKLINFAIMPVSLLKLHMILL